MTQEEKQLLLIDLCARLPYGVKLRYVEDLVVKKESHTITLNNIYLEHIINGDADIKPYLRPMSSMTEEEYTEYRTMQGRNCDYGEATICVSKSLYPRHLYDDGEPVKITVYYPNPVIQDWLNKKMFDYRGLIPMGLALEAPEGMYN
jgi:hypothetical protein